MPTRLELRLRGEHITLDQLLKATGVADSGGQAKAIVADGRVSVDGKPELRKTCKLRAGQVVTLDDVTIRVLGAEDAPTQAAPARTGPVRARPAFKSRAAKTGTGEAG